MRSRHHRHDPVPRPLSPRHRAWIYGLGGILLASGLGWLICHYGLRDPETDLPHPAEPWWLRVHGAAMLGFLITFGAILPGHLKHGWRYRLNTWSGTVITAVTILLTATGYGLYYLVDDGARSIASLVHSVLGLASTAILGWHVTAGHRLRAERLAGKSHAPSPAHSTK
jgi:hypothetical protein